MTLGDLIRNYRLSQGLSTRDFSERCGLSRAYISILERNINPSTGRPPIPSLGTIRSIASAIGMDFNELISILNENQAVSLEDRVDKPIDDDPSSDPKVVEGILKRIAQFDSNTQTPDNEIIHHSTNMIVFSPINPMKNSDAAEIVQSRIDLLYKAIKDMENLLFSGPCGSASRAFRVKLSVSVTEDFQLAEWYEQFQKGDADFVVVGGTLPNGKEHMVFGSGKEKLSSGDPP